MILEGTPIGHSLSEEERDVQEIVIKETRENIAKYQTSAGVKIPAECVVVVASKPTDKTQV